MPNAFDTAIAAANPVFMAHFADVIQVDGLNSRGIVSPDPELMLAHSVDIINGARLSVLAADHPDLAVGSSVMHGLIEYKVAELDRSPDPTGWLRAVLVRA